MTSPVDASEGDPADGVAEPVVAPVADDASAVSVTDARPSVSGVTNEQDAEVGTRSSPETDDGSRLAIGPATGKQSIRRGDGLADDARARRSAAEVVAAICPYLASAGGSWRMAVPSRDHRCLGLIPPTPQPVEKQRRHCLVADHVDCSIYRAARDARATALAGTADPSRIAHADVRRRAVPRTAPVLLEPPRLIDQVSRFQLDRTSGQLALVGLMVIAFVLVALSRLSGASGGDGPTPSASLISILPSESPRPTGTFRISLPPPSASAGASAAPEASFRTTYTVKKGDTLATIATRFKTTAAAIRTLNNLKSTTLKVGQVLKIP